MMNWLCFVVLGAAGIYNIAVIDSPVLGFALGLGTMQFLINAIGAR